MPKPLQSVLKKVDDVTDHGGTDLLSLVKSFGDRAFGPVLTLCGVILITPLGAIPGAPLALFLILASFALQIIFDRDHPWLPRVLKKIHISRTQVEKAKDVLRPVLKSIDGILRPRWPWAVGPLVRKIGALLILIVSATLIPIGLIPFAALVPGLIIITFGLGITARDGILIMIGFLLSAAYLGMVPWLFVNYS